MNKKQVDAWLNKWKDEWMKVQVIERMRKWTNEWKKELIDGWMNELYYTRMNVLNAILYVIYNNNIDGFIIKN